MSEETRGTTIGIIGVLLNEIIDSTEELKIANPNELVIGCKGLKEILHQGFERGRASLLTNYLSMSNDTKTREVASALSISGALRETLKSAPILSSLVEDKESLKDALNSLKKAEDRFKAKEYKEALKLAEGSQKSLHSIIGSSYNRLALLQERCVVSASVKSLSEMGYKLKKASNNKGTVIFGQKNEKSIVAVVLKEGDIYTDMAGFSGGRCEIELQEFFRRLRKEGVYISRKESLAHFRLSGGRMISRLNNKGLLSLLDVACKIESTTDIEEIPLSEERDPYYEQTMMWSALRQRGG